MAQKLRALVVLHKIRVQFPASMQDGVTYKGPWPLQTHMVHMACMHTGTHIHNWKKKSVFPSQEQIRKAQRGPPGWEKDPLAAEANIQDIQDIQKTTPNQVIHAKQDISNMEEDMCLQTQSMSVKVTQGPGVAQWQAHLPC